MMRFGCKTKVEKAWLVASLTAIVLHRLLEVEPGIGGMWLVEAAMIILTFPFAPLAMLFIAIGIDDLKGYTDLSWLFDWSTLLVLGYLQWFWALPEMRRRNQPITLNLTSPPETSPLMASPSATSPFETSPFETSPVVTSPVETLSTTPPDSSTLPELAPVGFDAAAFVSPFAEFDEAGRTALERVLRAPQTSPPALATLPCGVGSDLVVGASRRA